MSLECKHKFEIHKGKYSLISEIVYANFTLQRNIYAGYTNTQHSFV